MNAAQQLAPPMLQVTKLTKRYATTLALDTISFDVAPGEFVAILGRSGAGKTTLFRCLTRLVKPDSGTIIVDGAALLALRGRHLRAIRREIGLIFQQFNLIRRMTAIENVLVGRLGHVPTWRVLLRRFRHADRQLALASLDRVGLLEQAYQRADTLSGGQQQRVAIARVLAQRSRLILADEPVASLDPESAGSVLKTLRMVARERNIAVVCSLHQVELAVEFADRIIGLHAGRVVVDVPAVELGTAEHQRIYQTG
ncbi:MAG: phosphonate ABC transporter ATP-binding protein [Chloroflexota bacterium]|nr:phosphonate ABC transporter ATP-binding protein [Chloroflexota bacterium]